MSPSVLTVHKSHATGRREEALRASYFGGPSMHRRRRSGSPGVREGLSSVERCGSVELPCPEADASASGWSFRFVLPVRYEGCPLDDGGSV